MTAKDFELAGAIDVSLGRSTFRAGLSRGDWNMDVRRTQAGSDRAQRLGVLIEKDLTTPDQYPLSLNALSLGCNQKSNRDPVMDLLEESECTARWAS